MLGEGGRTLAKATPEEGWSPTTSTEGDILNQVGWMIIWFGRWTLVGVTSFGVDCARPDFPGKILDNLRMSAQLGCDLFSAGVYTRVDQYLDWIRSNV